MGWQMNLHEYQAKEVLMKYGVPVPPFVIVSNHEEAKQAIETLGVSQAVVKVQVHAGARGKAGGVKFAKSKEEILSLADELIGMKVVNNQTGPAGLIAHKVMITPGTDIKKEYYVGAILDRDRAMPMLIVSPEGGMDIETIAETMPDQIMTVPIALDGSVKRFQLLNIAKFMGWEGDVLKQGMKAVACLAKAFIETDASLLEINPLVVSTDGEVLAIDAKLSIDDNALYRQAELTAYYDPSQMTENEVKAQKYDLAYIALDGEIGCMVNGAGLAMSTMDIINFYGGRPANFLDVGGGADKEKVTAAFKILLSDPQVTTILVNIFGGIMDCAVIAEGVVAAGLELGISVPLIVRLEGTNVDEGKRILKESTLNLIAADSLGDAAQKAVKAAKECA